MLQNDLLWKELFLTGLKKVFFYTTIDKFEPNYVIDFSLRP